MTEKAVAYYRRLPYTRRVRLHEEGESAYFVAYVEELPALQIDGETKEEALKRLDDMFDDFIEAQLEWGEEIPEPLPWPGTGDVPQDPEVINRVVVELDLDGFRPTREQDFETPDPEWLRSFWRRRPDQEPETAGAT